MRQRGWGEVQVGMAAAEVVQKRLTEQVEGAERPQKAHPRAPLSAQRSNVVRLSDEPSHAKLEPGQWERHKFVGLTFDVMTLDHAIEQVVARADPLRPFSYVTTPNVDHRVRLEREPNLWAVYERAWLTFCDSRILEILANFDGARLPALPGADLVEHIIRTQIDPEEPINVVGGNASVIEGLRDEFGLTQVNWHDPPFGLRENPNAIEAAAEFVAAHPARFTFICVGSPQQEMVAHAIAERGDAVGVGLCCGASLGFLTGNVPRAPRWMRRIALEWLHRLATEPTRMYRRYLIDGPAIFPIWMRDREVLNAPPAKKNALRNGVRNASEVLEHAAE